ncbi:hypothetical protein [Lentilactobacillus kribbianus]|uniref:hypothetical protein n=1 Tax=Lentilactobacillus kribbianus TaxID=2729622 RepID=UPI001556FABD|nr:hypothetical protein [Lentilactobacillus kribbianus]
MTELTINDDRILDAWLTVKNDGNDDSLQKLEHFIAITDGRFKESDGVFDQILNACEAIITNNEVHCG